MKKVSILLLLLSGFMFNSCRREGCTDRLASNYDPKAKKSCGCCEYECKVVFWFDQDTKDWLVQEGVTTLKFRVNNAVLGTFAIGSPFDVAPSCDASGTSTIRIPLGRSKLKMMFYSVEDQNDNQLFESYIWPSADGCLAEELF